MTPHRIHHRLKFKDMIISLTDYYQNCHVPQLEDIVLTAVCLNKPSAAKQYAGPRSLRMP